MPFTERFLDELQKLAHRIDVSVQCRERGLVRSDVFGFKEPHAPMGLQMFCDMLRETAPCSGDEIMRRQQESSRGDGTDVLGGVRADRRLPEMFRRLRSIGVAHGPNPEVAVRN